MPSLSDVHAQMTALRAAGRHAEAAALVESAGHGFPRDRHQTLWWRLLATAAGGDGARAASILAEALDEGEWFPPDWLADSDDLATLRERPEFPALNDECSRRRAEATERAAPALMIAAPGARPKGAVLVLHANASNASSALPWWTAAVGLGWLLGVAQSGTPVGPDRYVWAAATTGEVRAHAATLAQRFGVAGPLVLAGTGRGAYHAMRLAIMGTVDARAAIGVAPAMSDFDEITARFASAGERGVRLWIDAGERDGRATRAAATIAPQLEAAGILVRTRAHEGGHEHPADFGETLGERLSFLTNTSGAP